MGLITDTTRHQVHQVDADNGRTVAVTIGPDQGLARTWAALLIDELARNMVLTNRVIAAIVNTDPDARASADRNTTIHRLATILGDVTTETLPLAEADILTDDLHDAMTVPGTCHRPDCDRLVYTDGVCLKHHVDAEQAHEARWAGELA